MTAFELRLRGTGGEPVDLRRVILSHGLASLPPFEPADDGRSIACVLPVPRGRPRAATVSEGRPGVARVTVEGPAPSAAARAALERTLRRMLALDEDLSPFYALAAADPQLAWATAGAGRMLRSPTVWEDVVKTICTTNCAWSATVRMVRAIVGELGEQAVGSPRRGFPGAAAVAAAGEPFWRDAARAGYRGAYLHALAENVAAGSLDLEALDDPSLPEEKVERRLLALPGVGPYAAAHVLLLLGRSSRLVLDSWTRPTYARLAGRKTLTDAQITRRFRRYGSWAGLAFWLVLTRDWAEESGVTES